ncbi:Thiolase, C-terminal domain [Desulforhopalus singaporensis]|uniref:Thiolase, C-terminal domain n=1 Tax=Desulforhopalus singaporensis TaxID=91360 RepID=A0A1H0V028_9BACT|nr:Thiolase, C-terminal domain [Desulforhopalus singaporensis]
MAEHRGLSPLGIYRDMAVTGCEPDGMGIGQVFAIPKLLKTNGLKMDDIGLWELNEAFAVQVVYCATNSASQTIDLMSMAVPSPSVTPTA